MVERALKKLEEQLDCSICLETYTDPKFLQCFHVYCQKCLVKLVVKNQQSQLYLNCPNGRQETQVPTRGVSDLPTAFHINQLLEIVEEHRKSRIVPLPASDASQEGTSPGDNGPLLEKSVEYCIEHDGNEVALYCDTCRRVICWKCIKKSGKHHSHDYEELDEDAFERCKEEISASLKPMEKLVRSVGNALADLEKCSEEIANCQADVEGDIRETMRKFREILYPREASLIEKLNHITQGKHKGLAIQRDQIETTQAQLSSCLLYTKENLKMCTQDDVLLMKKTTVRFKELTSTFQPEPNTNADMTFSATEDFAAVCQNNGDIQLSREQNDAL